MAQFFIPPEETAYLQSYAANKYGVSPRFTTHYNYIDCLCTLTKGVKIKYNNPYNKNQDLEKIVEKTGLISAMDLSIRAEIQVKNTLPEYCEASLPWIPIKIYYANFHRALRLAYLIDPQDSSLQLSHSRLAEKLTRLLETGALSFSNPLLNTVYSIDELQNSVTSQGELLRGQYDVEAVLKSILKHTSGYILENKKRTDKWNLRKPIHQEKKEQFSKNTKVSIFHHQMAVRERVNYKNMNYIEGVPTEYLSGYFDKFIFYGEQFGASLDELYEKMTSS